jgi:hypothetical protein
MSIEPHAFSLAALFAPIGREPDRLSMGELKNALKSHGVGSRAWRLYTEIGDELFTPLLALLSGGDRERARVQVTAFLRLIQTGEMDVPPSRQLVCALCRIQLPERGLAELPPHLFRALWKECANRQYRGLPVDDWLDDEAIPLVEWYVRTGQATHDGANRRRDGWTAYVRRHHDWLYGTARPEGSRRWQPVLPLLEYGPFRVRELFDERALFAEGKAMRHCVADWVGDCLVDGTHIFSIADRRTGLRLATVALAPRGDGRWSIIEFKGVSNTSPPAAIEEVAMTIVYWLDEHAR